MEFRFLTDSFYYDYRNCKEMEKKNDRPYANLCLIELNNMYFAIPIRHSIRHKYAIFTNKEKTMGLDLSKSVIITDIDRYVDFSTTAFISKDEYIFLSKRTNLIKKQLLLYINKYKKAYSNQQIPRNKLLCSMSCLQYFHKELGIN